MKTAEELVKHTPGIHSRRVAIILALCHGTFPNSAKDTALWIIQVANKIIEETEQ